MGHLQEAIRYTERAEASYGMGNLAVSETVAGVAIAHALIALVERLDALTVTDDSGKAALRTFRTVEL